MHWQTLSGAGISLKTQELYALVYIMRYLDLFTSFISLCALCLPGCLFVSWQARTDATHEYVSTL